MLTIKSLSSGIAAAALIGTIGLAYAQTTTEPTPAPLPAPTEASPTTPTQAPANNGMMPSTTDSSASTGMSPAQSEPGTSGSATDPLVEREPRADRN